MNLFGNQGFTLSADTTDVMNDTKLDFRNCYLKGVHGSAPGLNGFAFADISLFLAGELPKEFGKLVKLTYFNVKFNRLEGGLSTRTERLRT